MPPSGPVLSAGDPEPVAMCASEGGFLFTVEHAGCAVPARLGDLGLPAGEIDRHIGWDPGAADLARALHAMVGGTLIEQPYSRLVIDCNRSFEAPDLVAEIADGTPVPANRGLRAEHRRARWEEIHQPFHEAVAGRVRQRPRALVSLHSYDPQRRADAAVRPWPVGLLFRRETTLARHLSERLSQEALAAPLGLNEPYTIDDESDYTIPVHAEAAGLDHVLVEIRNDHLREAASVDAFARLLARALSSWSDR